MLTTNTLNLHSNNPPTPNDTVHVAVRVRPLNQREKSSSQEDAFAVSENSICQISPIDKKPVPGSIFSFDQIYPPAVPSLTLYNEVAREIILSCLNGVHGTIFAYGQTSSGKTYTMQGVEDEPGIIPLSIREIFQSIQQTPEREFLLRVSYMEIYNEVIRDLLDPKRTNLKVHETPSGDIFVGNLSERVVLSPLEVMDVMRQGETTRHVGETNMNERSSRSHTIFRMTIESKSDDELGAVKVSVLNLVDLAGSERVGHTGAEGIRLKEGGHINKSLLTLGSVIGKLSDGGDKGHIPYRDSKLTRILQPSLGGNARTAIVCTVTPASGFVEETLSTLKFANRAKNIVNRPEINEILNGDQALLNKYKKELNTLKTKLDTMQNLELEKQKAEETSEELWRKLQAQEEEKMGLRDQMDKLKKMILNENNDETHIKKKPRVARRKTWFPGVIASVPDSDDSSDHSMANTSMDSEITFDNSSVRVPMKRKSDTFVNGNEINLEFLKQKLESEKVLKTKLEQQLSEFTTQSFHVLAERDQELQQLTQRHSNFVITIGELCHPESCHKIKALRNFIVTTLTSLEKYEKEFHEWFDRAEFLRMESETRAEETNELKNQIESMKSELAASLERLDQASKDNDESENALTTLTEELSILRKTAAQEKDHLTLKIIDFQANLEARMRTLEQDLQKQYESRAAAEQELLNEKLHDMQKQKQSLCSEIESLQNQLAQKSLDFEALQSLDNHEGDEEEESMARIDELRVQLDTLKMEKQSLEISLNDRIDTLESQLREHEAITLTLQAEANAIHTLKQSFAGQLSHLETENTEISFERNTLYEITQNLENQLAELMAENEELKQRLSDTLAMDSLTQDLERTQKERDDALALSSQKQEALQTISGERDKKNVELEKLLSELKTKYERAVISSEELQKTVGDLESTLEVKVAELNTSHSLFEDAISKGVLEEKERELYAIKQELAYTRENGQMTIQTKNQFIQENESRIKELESRCEAMAQTSSEVESKCDEQEELIIDLTWKKNELTEKLKLIETQLVDTSFKEQNIQEALDQLQVLVAERDETISKSTRELQEAHETFTLKELAVTMNLESEIRRLELNLESQTAVIGQLHESLASAGNTFLEAQEEYQTELGSLHQGLESVQEQARLVPELELRIATADEVADKFKIQLEDLDLAHEFKVKEMDESLGRSEEELRTLKAKNTSSASKIQAELQNLHETLKSSKNENVRLVSELDIVTTNREQVVCELNDNKLALEAEFEKLKQQEQISKCLKGDCDNLEGHVSSLEQKLNVSRKEMGANILDLEAGFIENVRGEKQRTEAALDELGIVRTQVVDLTKRLLQKETEIKVSNNAINKVSAKIAHAETGFQQLEDVIREKDISIDNFKSQIQDCENEITRLTELEIESRNNEGLEEKLQIQTQRHDEQVAIITKNAELLTMELQRKSEELCAEAKRANELHKKVTLLDDNQIDMRMQHEDLESSFKNLEAELDETKSLLAEKKTLFASFDQKFNKMAKDKESLSTKLEASTVEISTTKAQKQEFEGEIRHLKEAYQHLNDIQVELTGRFETGNVVLKTCREQVVELKEDLVAQEREAEEFHAQKQTALGEIERLKNINSVKVQELADLKRLIEDLSMEKGDSSRELNSIHTEKRRAEMQIEDLEYQLNEYAERVAEISAENKNFATEGSKLLQNNTLLREELQDKSFRVVNLCEELAVIRQSSKELTIKLTAKVADYENILDRFNCERRDKELSAVSIGALQSQAADLDSKLKNETIKAEEALEQLASQEVQIQGLVATEKTAGIELGKQKARIEGLCQTLHEREELLARSSAALQAGDSMSKEDIEKVSAEQSQYWKNELTKKGDEIQNLHVNLDALLQQNEKIRSASDRRETKFNQMEAQIEEKQRFGHSHIAETVELKRKISDLETEVERLRRGNETAANNSMSSNGEGDHYTLVASLGSQNDFLQKENNKLKKEIQCKSMVVENERRETMKRDSELTALKHELSRLKASLQNSQHTAASTVFQENRKPMDAPQKHVRTAKAAESTGSSKDDVSGAKTRTGRRAKRDEVADGDPNECKQQ